jgi:SHS2 domain-containing protein
MKRYEFLEHTADLKFKVYGDSKEKIFENTVLAISKILAKGNKIKISEKKKIEIRGKGREELLYLLIDEIIFLLDAESFITTKAKVKFNKLGLIAEFSGDKAKNYKNLDHIKAATYSEMYIKRKKDGWEAQAVVDV